MTPDPFTVSALPEELESALGAAAGRLGPFGRRILWHPETSSTNDVAAVFAERGADEGLVVVADYQSAGRGRLGRAWISPPGAGLYVSIVLRPTARALPLLTIAAGVAVAEAVAVATGLDLQLKWPNDVHIGGRKLAGILAEGAAQHVVLGIGINVLLASYPRDVADRATSIEAELGRPPDRGVLLAECLSSLAKWYRVLTEQGGRPVVEAWRLRAASTLGRRVEWEAGPATRRGLAENIDEAGALLVRSGSELVPITSGVVRWL